MTSVDPMKYETRLDWALARLEQDGIVQDICKECGKVLFTYPTDPKEMEALCEAGLGPLVSPSCGPCSANRTSSLREEK